MSRLFLIIAVAVSFAAIYFNARGVANVRNAAAVYGSNARRADLIGEER